MRQDGVGVSVAHVGLLVGRDALDGRAHRDGEGGPVLQQFDLVDQRGAQLVGRELRVRVGAEPEDLELLALNRLPDPGGRAL